VPQSAFAGGLGLQLSSSFEPCSGSQGHVGAEGGVGQGCAYKEGGDGAAQLHRLSSAGAMGQVMRQVT